jgi:hypothetical protein
MGSTLEALGPVGRVARCSISVVLSSALPPGTTPMFLLREIEMVSVEAIRFGTSGLRLTMEDRRDVSI